MAKKVTAQMSTEIALDTIKASESIKTMTALVNSNTASWKAQEAQLKSSGDYLKASQARYDGLSESIANQQKKVDALKDKQSALKGNTEEVARAYLNYDKQISQAETKLASMTAQQNRAKDSLLVQKSGVIELNNAYKLQMSVLDSQVAKLKAQGDEYRALKVQQSGLKDSLTNLMERERKQKELLSQMTEGSDEWKKQQVRVNELGTKVAETTSKIRSLNTEIKEANPIGLTKINDRLDTINDRAEKTSSLFGKIFGAEILSNAVSNAFTAIQAHFTEIIASAKEYDIDQQKLIATWTTLTGSADKANDMKDTINQLAIKTGQATETVNELEQGFYHLNSNKTESDAMTKSMLNMADAVGLSGDQIQAVTQDMVNGLSRGKANAGMLNQISQYFPMFREQLAKYETQVNHGKEVTVADLGAMAKAGKISSADIEKVFESLGNGKYDKAADNMLQTMYGMERTIKSRMPALVGEIYEPIMQMKNPLIGQVSAWTTDPKTITAFKSVGNELATQISDIMTAFDVKGTNVSDTLNGLLGKLKLGIQDLGQAIVKHKDDIKEFLGAMKTSSITTWQIFWQTLKDLEPVMAIVGKLAEKYPKQFAWMLTAGIVISKVSVPLAFLVKTIKGFNTISSFLFEKLGLWKSKLAVETGEVEAQTKAYQELTIAKEEASAVGSTGGTVSKVGSEVSTAENTASEVESTASTLTSDVGSASKLSKYLSIGKNIGGKLVTGVGLAMTAYDVGDSIVKAVGSKSSNAKYQAVGKTTGAVLGGAIGGVFGGPIGISIGSQIGTAIGGSKTVTNALKKLKKNWDNSVNGYHLKSPKISTKTSLDTLEKAQKKYYSNHAKQISKDNELLYKEHLISKSQYDAQTKLIQQETKKENTISSLSHASQLKLAKKYANDKQDIDKKYNAQRSKILDKYNNDIRYEEERGGKNSIKAKKLIVEKKKALDKLQNAQDKATAKLTQKYSTDTTSTYQKNQNKITSLITSSSAKQKTLLQKLANDSKKINANNAKDTLASANKEYNQVVDIANKKYKKVKDLADKQYQAVKSSAEKQQKSAIASATKQYNDTISASERQFKGNSDYAVKQRQKIASEASKQYEETVDSANKQYSETVAHAKKQHDGTVASAQKQHSEVASEAEKQHLAVVASASNQSKGVLGHAVNQANGSMDAQSRQAKGTTTMWNSVLDFFNKLGKAFGFDNVKSDKVDFSYSAMGMPAYSTGTGSISKSQMALVGESGAELAYQPYSGTARLLGAKGAEITQLNQGEMILNANDTKKVLEGNYQGILKGYASGTSTLEGFISKVKSGASSIWDKVSDSVGSILDDIKDPVKYLTNIADKAFNPTSVANVGSVAQDLTKGLISKSMDGIGSVLAKLIKGYDSNSGASAPSGSGVQRWKDQVKSALAKVGLSTSDDMVNAWLKQISTESGGNEKAIQGNIGDINNRTGDLAKGLLQVISTTFNAYKVNGHDNIFNGYDNMLSAMSYAKARYGSKLLSVIGHGHGYENGGIISQHGMYEISEKNKAEMILPLTNKSRASQLLASIGAKFDSDNSSSNTVNSSDDVKELSAKLDDVITMFGTLLTLTGENIKAVKSNGDKKSLYTNMAKDMGLASFQQK